MFVQRKIDTLNDGVVWKNITTNQIEEAQTLDEVMDILLDYACGTFCVYDVEGGDIVYTTVQVQNIQSKECIVVD